MRASIIIVSYNHRSHLEACLRSLEGYLSPNDEIVLVDNASSDGSAAYVEYNFPYVRVIRSQNNLGFAEGNNVGARQALGEYLAFLNPDTVVTPGWLDELVTALDDRPNFGLATSKILLLNDPQRVNAAGNDIHLGGLTMCRVPELTQGRLAQVAEVNAISGAAFVIKRELFELLGGFDPDFFLYMEDTDLSYRARLGGRGSLYVPSSIIYHDYSLRFGPRKIYYQERNRYMMLLKSLRWPSLLVLTPTLLLTEVVSWGFVLLRGRGGYQNKLDAYRWIGENWPRILQKRRAVQKLRRLSDRQLLRQTGFSLSFDQVDNGVLGALARVVFNPLFFVLRVLTFLFLWW